MHYAWGRSQDRQCHVSYCSYREYVASAWRNRRRISRGHGMTPICFHFNIHLVAQRVFLCSQYEQDPVKTTPFSTFSTKFRKESNERDVPSFNGASRKIQRQIEIRDANDCNLPFFCRATRRLIQLTSVFCLAFCLYYNSSRSFTVTSISSEKLSDKLCTHSF